MHKYKNVALVDFDGVVLKNAYAKKYIDRRIKQFVKRKLNTNNKTVVEQFAKHIYCSHGHTQYGLSKHGFTTTLSEFNYYVYESYDAKQEYKNISLSKHEKAEWEGFQSICKQNDIDVKLFSNAPVSWLQNFISYDKSVFDLSEYLERYRHTDAISKHMLKPTKKIAQITSLFLSNKYDHYYFIDDSLRNLSMVANNRKYTGIWYNSDIGDTKEVTDNFFILDNLNNFDTIITNNIAKDTQRTYFN
jgi:FMN phosphatase YigB (HAD superfamily)